MKNNTDHDRYAVGPWKEDDVPTWQAQIYVGGDRQTAEMVCRRLCFPKGMCLSIDSTLCIFAGGAEGAVRVTLFQYPPFPEDEAGLLAKACWVGREIAEANHQWSYSVVASARTYFFSQRRK